MRSRTRRSTRWKKPDSPWCAARADIYDLGQEFFRWEIATAVACSIIGINAFNQPDVEASKIETHKLTDEYEKRARFPPETPFSRKRCQAFHRRRTPRPSNRSAQRR